MTLILVPVIEYLPAEIACDRAGRRQAFIHYYRSRPSVSVSLTSEGHAGHGFREHVPDTRDTLGHAGTRDTLRMPHLAPPSHYRAHKA